MRRRVAALAFLPLIGATPVADLDVRVAGLRDNAGVLRLCLTANPRKFPSCVGDPRAIARTVPAGQQDVNFAGLPAGDWAVAIIHDANGNAKLDTVMGIPREGFGFSNNPPIRFGAPSFNAARFTLTDGTKVETIRMKYLL
jgi:uncharacterized protein (DUF2141 family)